MSVPLTSLLSLFRQLCIFQSKSIVLFLMKLYFLWCLTSASYEKFCSTFARCNYYRELTLESVSTFSRLQKVPLVLRHAIVIVTFIRGFAHSQGAFSWSSTAVGDTSARSSFSTVSDLLSLSLFFGLFNILFNFLISLF